MILPTHERLRAAIAARLTALYGLAPAEQPAIAIDYAPSRALGDLAVPVAFELARRLRKAPRAIAQELAGALGQVEGFARIEAAPNGYLNCFLDRPAFVVSRLTGAVAPAPATAEGKTIVEHTAINPNKAAHIGHLRNSALGDTLVRVLRFCGVPVEVQNYIDDTGVQVADVVVGFQTLEQASLERVKALAAAPRFDYYCWDLYARVTEWYDEDKTRLAVRQQALHDIEHGGNAAAEMGAFIADAIVRRHLETMRRLHIDYDLLTWEGDILRLRFWAHAFEILKQQGTVYYQTEGRLAGCWVMAIDDGEGVQGGDGASSSAASSTKAEAPRPGGEQPVDADEDEGREKVIVRSNGTVTYVGKDIAYQFWKFGLLGLDFRYRRFATRADGAVLWATTSGADDTPGHPAFGAAARTYNVIDVRQSYLQKLLKQALAAMGHTAQAERSVHFSYEMVALSHDTARQLGFQAAAEESKKPFVEVSGRKGLGVKADDLIDVLERTATAEVARRNPDLPAADIEATGREIAVAAVRYFMIKYSRGKVIAFDIDEALSFEGESGPYLQYAAVRANNIFAKLEERMGFRAAAAAEAVAALSADALTGAEGDELWGLVLDAARLDEIVEQVVRTLEFSVLAKYAFGLAQAFNGFYHRAPILNEDRADVRTWRAAGVAYVRSQLTAALDLMGIAVPVRM
jgi:arginyl-tRNA synthetase